MDVPIPIPGFVETDVFKMARKQMDLSSVDVITLLGPSGSGKSTLAMELCAYTWPHNLDPNQIHFIFRRFNCSKIDSLYDELNLFYQDIDKIQTKLSANHTKTWDILQTVFRDMNTFFPHHVKLFILDDAERIDDILKVMNYLHHVIKMTPVLDGRWKLLITSQKSPSNREFYASIGKDTFFDIEGFTFDEVKRLFQSSSHTLSDADVEEIIPVLGQRPLILKIFMSSLQSNQVEEVSDIVQNLLVDIEAQLSALDQSDRDDPLTSALVGVKVSIERLLDELPHRDESLQVIKLLTMLNERNITVELLVACAETAIDCPKKAAVIIKNLTSRLMDRGICTKRFEEKVPLFRLHQLVKQSMMLFVREEEKISLLEKALVALTRVMPKDGRKHQTRLVGFYGDHGKSLDKAIKDTIGRTPFILLLHCSMLTSMGYCHLAQRTGDYKRGERLLKEALNKYCELVRKSDYDSLLSPRESSDLRIQIDSSNLRIQIECAKSAARELFIAGAILDWSNSESYKQYIADLPLYHRLTKKDLANMVDDPARFILVNGHLTRDQLNELVNADKKVVKAEALPQVYIAEVLAQIYCVWSTIHRKMSDNAGAVDQSLVHAEAAIQIFSMIYDKHGVYLLAGLITERDMLSAKLKQVTTADDVREIYRKLTELSDVGLDERKRYAYEAGVIRSDLSKDQYHELLCRESAINCQGRLYELTNNDVTFYEKGKELFEEVKELAKTQFHKHSTLSYSHKNFANFLYNCKKYGEAVVSILRAMLELRESLRNGDSPPGHPELTHPRFKPLYSSLDKYYSKYSEERERTQAEQRLLHRSMDECAYLNSAINSWREFCQKAEREMHSNAENLAIPSEERSRAFRCLEAIHEKEIDQVGTFILSHSTKFVNKMFDCVVKILFLDFHSNF